MKIFGKERQSLVVAGIRAARAVYKGINDQDCIEVEFITPNNERLTLQIEPRMVPGLISNLADSYEAVCPPLHKGGYGENQAAFFGMG